jgi:hypothetical protein
VNLLESERRKRISETEDSSESVHKWIEEADSGKVLPVVVILSKS